MPAIWWLLECATWFPQLLTLVGRALDKRQRITWIITSKLTGVLKQHKVAAKSSTGNKAITLHKVPETSCWVEMGNTTRNTL